MRRSKSTMILGAKRGRLDDLQSLVNKIHTHKEFIIPNVFEAFLEHLKASKVPSIDSFRTSFERADNQFKNLVVERALLSVHGLAQAAIFKDIVRSDASIRDLLKFRWPGVLDWLHYFYVGCFKKNLADEMSKEAMAERLNLVFVLATLGLGDDLVIAIGAVPGTIRLATQLFMLENEGSYGGGNDLHIGTTVLVQFLHIKGDTHALDEVVRALKGKSTLIVESAVARLKKTVESPKISMDSAMIQLSLLMKFAAAPKHHPLWLALHRKNPIAIVTNVLTRPRMFGTAYQYASRT